MRCRKFVNNFFALVTVSEEMKIYLRFIKIQRYANLVRVQNKICEN